MLRRLINCTCHPKNIGKHFKDSFIVVLFTILIFFVLYMGVFAARVYNEPAFYESDAVAISSRLIKEENLTGSYDSTTFKITSPTKTIEGNGFNLYIMPTDYKINNIDKINIVLYETGAEVYFGSVKASSVSYASLKCADFSFDKMAQNDVSTIYNFKLFIMGVLNSSSLFFQTLTFFEGIFTTAIMYLLVAFFCYIFAGFINLGIDRGIRVKLVAYDACIFLVEMFFITLFNWGSIIYIAMILPLIFTFITFRHIVKVVVRK